MSDLSVQSSISKCRLGSTYRNRDEGSDFVLYGGGDIRVGISEQ